MASRSSSFSRRRSETGVFDRFDVVQNLEIVIDIDSGSKDQLQSIAFNFDCANLKEFEDYWEGV